VHRIQMALFIIPQTLNIELNKLFGFVLPPKSLYFGRHKLLDRRILVGLLFDVAHSNHFPQVRI
jgi:hypothetical protein